MELKKLLRDLLKIISIISICALGLFGILALFGLTFNLELSIVLTLATLLVASIMAFNPLGNLEKHRIMALISFILISISATMTIILIWVKSFADIPLLINITGTIAIFSVVLSVILSNIAKLDKKHKLLQILLTILYAYIGTSFIVLLWNTEFYSILFINKVWFIYVIAIIVAVILRVVLIIFAKSLADEEKNNLLKTNNGAFSGDSITISRKEYESMKVRISELEKENNELKMKL